MKTKNKGKPPRPNQSQYHKEKEQLSADPLETETICLKDADINESDIEVGTIKLDIGYEATSVELTEWVSVKLDKAGSGAS